MRTRIRVTALPTLIAAGYFAAVPSRLSLAARQSASPAASPMPASNPYADLGLPEITLEFTSISISGMQETLEAGRYLVTIHGEPSEEDFGFGTLFLRLPDGMTVEDAMAEAGGSPEGPPAFLFDSLLPGGPAIMADTGQSSAQAVIDLEPGDWIVAGQGLSQPPVPFTVTGEMPAELPEPESTVTVSMREMMFEFSDGGLTAGENLLRIDNVGEQVHQIEVEKLPEGTTRETIENTLQWEMTGTPVADVLDFSQIQFVGISGFQSAGTSMWMPLSLEPGIYGIFCFLPDEESGMPHAFMGMWDLVEISG